MGGCIPFFFGDLQMAYQNRTPPLNSPDKHIIPISWHVLNGGLYVFLIIVQIASLGQVGNLIFYPMVFLTALFFYRMYQKKCITHELNPIKAHPSDLYRAFFHCMWGGSMFALFWETVQSLIYAIIISGGQDDLGSNGGWKVQIMTILTAFVIAGVTEEMAKAIILQHCVKLYLPHRVYLDGSYVKPIIWMGLATGLGFGTMEGILYTCVYGISDGYIGQFIILLIRLLLAIPFHTLTGLMWGMELSRKECLSEDKNWIELGYKQVLWHGLYDFVEMEYGLFTPSDDLGLALLGIVIGYVIVFIAAFIVRYDYKRLTSNEFLRLPDREEQQQP